MPLDGDAELAAKLEEIEHWHIARQSRWGYLVCDGCSDRHGKYEMAWPCIAAELAMMVRRQQASMTASQHDNSPG